MRRMLATAAILIAVLPGCGDASKQTAGTRPSTPVKISIVQPKAGSVLTGKTFTVKISLKGGKIVKQTTRKITPVTEGHVHVSVDGNILSQTFGLTQTLDMPDTGRHLLQVEFVAKDHGPFDPRVLDAAPFEVRR